MFRLSSTFPTLLSCTTTHNIPSIKKDCFDPGDIKLRFPFATLYGIYSSFIYFDLNQHSQLFKQALLSCIAAHCVPSTEKGLFWSWWYKVAVPNAKTLVSKSLIKTCDNNLALHSRLKLNLRKTRGTLWKYRGDETITFVNQKSKKPKSKSYKDTFVLNWFIFCDPFTQIWVLKVRWETKKVGWNLPLTQFQPAVIVERRICQNAADIRVFNKSASISYKIIPGKWSQSQSWKWRQFILDCETSKPRKCLLCYPWSGIRSSFKVENWWRGQIEYAWGM